MSEFEKIDAKALNAALSVHQHREAGGSNIVPPRLDELHAPHTHEERLAWVKQSYERFFEKVREHDALLRLAELH